MEASLFKRLSADVVDYWAQYLESPDLAAFRLTCTQANAYTFRVTARRFFTRLRTSLMGEDLRKFESAMANGALCEHVRILCIEDGFERNDGFERPDGFPAPKTSHVWPRDDMMMIDSTSMGVASLRHMLTTKTLCLEKIIIRDYRDYDTTVGVEPAAMLAQEITEDIDLGITTIEVNQVTGEIAEVVLRLSREHQGRGVGFSSLHSARLCRSHNMTTYWSDKILYQSPALQNLALDFRKPGKSITVGGSPAIGALPTSPATLRLRSLEIRFATLHGRDIISTLENSWGSLESLAFTSVTLSSSLTWREMLRIIASRCTALSSVKLWFLEEGPFFGGKNIKFRTLVSDDYAEQYRSGLTILQRGPVDNRRVRSVKYQGSNARDVLALFAAAII